MTSVFYSEQARNAQLSQNMANASHFQSQPYISPLSFLDTVHLPSPLGAHTTIPGGPYATSVDVSSGAREGMYTNMSRSAAASTNYKLIGIAVVLAAFYIFLPQKA